MSDGKVPPHAACVCTQTQMYVYISVPPPTKTGGKLVCRCSWMLQKVEDPSLPCVIHPCGWQRTISALGAHVWVSAVGCLIPAMPSSMALPVPCGHTCLLSPSPPPSTGPVPASVLCTHPCSSNMVPLHVLTFYSSSIVNPDPRNTEYAKQSIAELVVTKFLVACSSE